jgi:hypothetical protein
MELWIALTAGGSSPCALPALTRGDAQGRADVRLNGDRNEVEMINVNGRMGRTNFTGNFGRN